MTSNCDKNESSRFLGDGVSFRAKLIGVLEVAEARGDRMCQEALSDLKIAVRAAGEHKQRIQVHVAIDGLRLRDDKTGDSLYHHPVHKISFIAQDMSDSRAFGYIFGSPDTGHRFFGIKTDKAAGHVVIAMRDLFQVVFELKKKEIELARQQLESKAISSAKHQDSSEQGQTLGLMRWPVLQSTNGESSGTFKLSEVTMKALSTRSPALNISGASSGSAAVAELVDLEQELSSLRRGLNEMEGLTPKDPFGDSFAGPSKGMLPPPPGAGRESRTRSTASSSGIPSDQTEEPIFSPAKTATTTFDSPRHSVDKISVGGSSILSKTELPEEKTPSAHSQIFDVFTDLDPLGTGRSKPYIDKKHFFQELKNPPKKVLKDLVPGSVPSLLDSGVNFVPSFEPSKSEPMYTATTITSVGTHSGGSVSIAKATPVAQIFPTSNLYTIDPFAETDPFDSADPFSDSQQDDPFAAASTGFSLGHFRDLGIGKGCLPPTEMIRDQRIDDNGRVKFITEPLSTKSKSVFNGPLQVSLPPEPCTKSPRLPRQTSESQTSTIIRQRPQISKQQTLHSGSTAPSPPPPLPPKKNPLKVGTIRPPPRPPHGDSDYHDPSTESIPPIPNPARKWGLDKPVYYSDRHTKASLSSTGPESNDDEYLTPIPPPILPGSMKRHVQPSPGLNITLSQLLTCSMEELAPRLNVPLEKLSNMTLPQLTTYLREYLETNKSNGHWKEKDSTVVSEKEQEKDFRANFEDNFSLGSKPSSEPFVADFDKFCANNSSTYDRYAAFREIQELELKTQQSSHSDSGELVKSDDVHKNNVKTKDSLEVKEKSNDRSSLNSSPRPSDESGQFLSLNAFEKSPDRKSPLKSLDELVYDSLGAFTCITRANASPRPDSKFADLKTVINIIHKSSHSPRPDNDNVSMSEAQAAKDRYAALRDITTIEVTADDSETAVPPDGPKERKKSDERSDGFDNSDFFDCIDNSSLSLSHGEDALRKSPLVLKDTEKKLLKSSAEKVGKKLNVESAVLPISPSNLLSQPPSHLSAGSLSDIVSGSSPEIGASDKSRSRNHGASSGGGREETSKSTLRRRRRRDVDEATWLQKREANEAWSTLRDDDDGASPWSSDSATSPPRRQGDTRGRSGRYGGADMSLPPSLPRPRRRTQHPKTWQTKQTSSSSRDVSPWDEDPPKPRLHPRPQHTHRERKDSASSKDRHDSGSGRDKEVTRELRDSGSGRDREIRDRDTRRDHERVRSRDPEWEREYSMETTKDRSKSRDKERERNRRRHHSWDDEDGYSDGRTSHASGSVRRYSPSGAVSGASSGCSAGRSSRDARDPRREPWRGDKDYRDDDRAYVTVARSSRRRGEVWQDEDSSRYGNTLGSRSRRSGSSRSRESRESEGRSHGRRQQLYYNRSPKSPFEDDFAPPARYTATPSPRSDRESPHSSHPPRTFGESDKRTRQCFESSGPIERESPVTVATKNLPARFRFSNDFSGKESLKSQHSPFDNDFLEAPSPASFKKSTRYAEGSYSSFDKESPILSKLPGFGKFKFDNENEMDNFSASPSSIRHGSKPTHSLLYNEDSPTPHAGKFRFDTEPSPTQKSLFEDDFSPEPRNGILRTSEQSLGGCGESIAEEDENNLNDKVDKNVGFDFGANESISLQESRKSHSKFKVRSRQDMDLKKSESINIFTRDKDPFDGDEFFSCTSSNKVATKDKWPGDFANFDDV